LVLCGTRILASAVWRFYGPLGLDRSINPCFLLGVWAQASRPWYYSRHGIRRYIENVHMGFVSDVNASDDQAFRTNINYYRSATKGIISLHMDPCISLCIAVVKVTSRLPSNVLNCSNFVVTNWFEYTVWIYACSGIQ
jgi:hypothetical protein